MGSKEKEDQLPQVRPGFVRLAGFCVSCQAPE